jgi:hypothetical protein
MEDAETPDSFFLTMLWRLQTDPTFSLLGQSLRLKFELQVEESLLQTVSDSSGSTEIASF